MDTRGPFLEWPWPQLGHIAMTSFTNVVEGRTYSMV
jgi:hypothetical protein